MKKDWYRRDNTEGKLELVLKIYHWNGNIREMTLTFPHFKNMLVSEEITSFA